MGRGYRRRRRKVCQAWSPNFNLNQSYLNQFRKPPLPPCSSIQDLRHLLGAVTSPGSRNQTVSSSSTEKVMWWIERKESHLWGTSSDTPTLAAQSTALQPSYNNSLHLQRQRRRRRCCNARRPQLLTSSPPPLSLCPTEALAPIMKEANQLDHSEPQLTKKTMVITIMWSNWRNSSLK